VYIVLDEDLSYVSSKARNAWKSLSYSPCDRAVTPPSK